ncbi:hypothetical protein WJX84_007567 [Apatococcus fuscideae]|uniref:Uncharacterized protein n=1 Tax=Apatococcus fuscideae TaxID=2026836 RepID=A0AAW1T2R0_9CHLO
MESRPRRGRTEPRSRRDRSDLSPGARNLDSQDRGRWGDAPPVPQPAQPKLVDEDFIYVPKSGQFFEHDDRSVWRPPKRARSTGFRGSEMQYDQQRSMGKSSHERHGAHDHLEQRRHSRDRLDMHRQESHPFEREHKQQPRDQRPSDRRQDRHPDMDREPGRDSRRADRSRETAAPRPQLRSEAHKESAPDQIFRADHPKAHGHDDRWAARPERPRAEPGLHHAGTQRGEGRNTSAAWPSEPRRGDFGIAPWGGRGGDPSRKASWSHDMFEEINRSPSRQEEGGDQPLSKTALPGPPAVKPVLALELSLHFSKA